MEGDPGNTHTSQAARQWSAPVTLGPRGAANIRSGAPPGLVAKFSVGVAPSPRRRWDGQRNSDAPRPDGSVHPRCRSPSGNAMRTRWSPRARHATSAPPPASTIVLRGCPERVSERRFADQLEHDQHGESVQSGVDSSSRGRRAMISPAPRGNGRRPREAGGCFVRKHRAGPHVGRERVAGTKTFTSTTASPSLGHGQTRPSLQRCHLRSSRPPTTLRADPKSAPQTPNQGCVLAPSRSALPPCRRRTAAVQRRAWRSRRSAPRRAACASLP
jgi:hypothetical protein